MNIRIGEGWDVHALVPGRKLILGGVEIAHTVGLMGHSDADVLLHAITDAVLGAAGLGDIGRHFPDTDVQFKGADSSVLLAEAMRRVRAQGWELVNVDSTIVAQAPKLAPHMSAINSGVAKALGVTRILTSGQPPTAWEGADLIRRLVDQAAGRMDGVWRIVDAAGRTLYDLFLNDPGDGPVEGGWRGGSMPGGRRSASASGRR